MIAYVLPGFVILFGISLVSPIALNWLSSAEAASGPSVGGFLFAFLFSVAAGVTTSAVRWLVLDRVHQLMGIKRPQLDLRNLEDRRHSFERVVEDHYRYHEFYGGMLIATLFSYSLWRVRQSWTIFCGYDFPFLTIEIVFALASRDALRNYYGRAARVLGTLDGEASNDQRIRTSRRSSNEEVDTARKERAGVREGTIADQTRREDR
jgi:hypothetical protein